MRLGSARASGVPLLSPTVRMGSEGKETYLHYTWHTASKRKQLESWAPSSSDSELETETKSHSNSFPHFLVVEAKDYKSFEKISPFAIAKSVKCNIGTEKRKKASKRIIAGGGHHAGIRRASDETGNPRWHPCDCYTTPHAQLQPWRHKMS